MKVIEIAKAELGYLEKATNKNLYDKTANAGSGNFTKYWADLCPSYQGQPWCLAFCCWCLEQAYSREEALNMLNCKNYTYYTPTQAMYFQNAKKWEKQPVLGSLIFFKNNVRIYHVGLVVDINNDLITTIEGNTSSGTEVIANGGGVYMKQYKTDNSKIAGYGVIDYPKEYQVGWNKSDGRWWYADTESTYYSDCIAKINEKYYAFDKEGWMIEGEFKCTTTDNGDIVVLG